MPCDRNFQISVDNYRRINRNSINIGGEQYNCERNYSKKRIGFTDAHFDAGRVRTNFWIKPDFFAYKPAVEANCVDLLAVEHCGSWQNLYQKRFIYFQKENGVCLSFFNYSPTERIWIQGERIKVNHIVYLLKDSPNKFERRIVKISPSLAWEKFDFTYSKWENENEEFNSAIFEGARSRQQWLEEWARE